VPNSRGLCDLLRERASGPPSNGAGGHVASVHLKEKTKGSSQALRVIVQRTQFKRALEKNVEVVENREEGVQEGGAVSGRATSYSSIKGTGEGIVRGDGRPEIKTLQRYTDKKGTEEVTS